MTYRADCEVWLKEGDKAVLGEEGASLLANIREARSVALAATALGLSEPEVLEAVRRIEGNAGFKVMSPEQGGGSCKLTDEGELLLEEYRSHEKRVKDQVEHLYRGPTLTADGIVVIDGKMVLIKRGRDPGRGKYALPGGFVEYGERAEDCAVREVLEETGLEAEVLGLLGIYSDPSRDPRGHIASAVYVLRLTGGVPKAGDDAEGVELFPLDRLPELAFDHAKIIGDYLRHKPQKYY